jgi:hypothetical protein
MSQDSQDRRTDRPGSPQNGAGKPPPETLTTRDEQTSRAAPFRSREVNELAIMGSAMAGRGPGRPSLPVAVRLRVLALRAEHRDWSLRKLGKAAGCSKDTVARVLAAELAAVAAGVGSVGSDVAAVGVGVGVAGSEAGEGVVEARAPVGGRKRRRGRVGMARGARPPRQEARSGGPGVGPGGVGSPAGSDSRNRGSGRDLPDRGEGGRRQRDTETVQRLLAEARARWVQRPAPAYDEDPRWWFK